MHVCHLSQSVSTHGGGISEAIRALAMAQEAAGTNVSVMSVRDAGGELAPWPHGAPQWLHVQKLPGMLRLPDLAEQLDEADPDITHVHGLWTWLSVGVPRWAARRNRPAIVSPHGMLDAWALNHSRWKKRIAGAAFERRHLESAACIHALCQSEAESIRAYGLKNPIAIIPNGVEWVNAEKLKTETLKSGRMTLLFLGRIHPKKGLANALKAWAEIRSQEEWIFAIAGWDQDGHEAELKRLCDELSLTYADISAEDFISATGSSLPSSVSQSSVFFLGSAFGETKDALLRSASAFILPSFSEGLPMSVLEAWAHQLPVLMTDHCNLPDGFAADAAIRIGTGIRRQEAGDRGYPKGTDEGMRTLMEMTDTERVAMGQRGRVLVEQRYTWPQIAAQMNEVYAWILGSGARPACLETC